MRTYKPRPINCVSVLGDKDRCPYCGQFHLRLGYCQALDSINAGQYPGIWDGSIVVNLEHCLSGSEYLVRFGHRANTADLAESQPVAGISRENPGLPQPVDSRSDNFAHHLLTDSAGTDVDGTDCATFAHHLFTDSMVTCEVCGVSFEPPRKGAKYCSPACRTKASRVRKK
jgi:hypothetical protein